MNEQDRQIEEIEVHEAWLAGFKSPAPSAEAVTRAKQAARREAARMLGTISTRSWKSWQGVLGAAAAIALCVTVGWFAVDRTVPTQPLAAVEAEVQQLLPESARQETVQLASMDDDMTDLEEWSSEQRWSAGGASMYHALEDALNDDSSSEPVRGGTTKSGRSQG